jgi:hypothetical protein
MRLAAILGALFIALPIGLFVVTAILADAVMLFQSGGWVLLLVYLALPILILLFGDDPYRG